jgi:NADH-quinone oxidoreductase subunit C
VENLAEAIQTKFPNLVKSVYDLHGDAGIVIKKEGIKEIARFLKNDPEFGFNVLMDLAAVDYLRWEEKEFRFEVIYNLFSLQKNRRIFVKAQVHETQAELDSVSAVWPAANWYEREVWDMFGISFKGHPNLKRILMYEEFQGYPLRKDYPYNQRQPLIGPLN